MKRAFSLVELSIVLVILGLLVGGILAGQSLIHAAELRSVSTDVARFSTASKTFRDKYFALPGDMSNATAVWGLAGGGGTGTDVGCYNTSSTDAKTCNGDGNGIIFSYEPYRAWQHMANAGLIEGIYPGVIGSTPRVNVPGSRVSSASFWYIGGSIPASTGNFLIPTDNNYTLQASPMLKPEDMYNIDTKMDDGLPGKGRVIASKGSTTADACSTAYGVNAPGDASATYSLSNSGLLCLNMFFLGSM